MDKTAFFHKIREEFADDVERERKNRENAIEDIEFANNVGEGQWPGYIKQEREGDKRPCITVNKLRKFVKQLIGDQRQNRFSIKVRPVDDKSDIKTAKIYEDLIRAIEYNSVADVAYDTAYEHAITGGFGYFRVVTEYADDNGFEQEIKIKRIKNQFSVYFGDADEFDNSDAPHCFVTEMISKSEFEEKYPNHNPVDFEFAERGETYSKWFEKDKVRIAEYYYKVPVKETIAQASNGEIFRLSNKVTRRLLEDNGYQIVKERVVESHKIMFCKLTGADFLEEPREWIGKYIPIVAVKGDEINVEGKTILMSLIRNVKDPQRFYNYWITNMAETIALAPRAPYLVTETQITGHETMWKEANIKNRPYLLYSDVTGKGAPKREAPPQVPTGAMAMLDISGGDIKDTLGMYEPTLGDKSNERSGKAILAKQRRTDLGTYSFIDNLQRAMVYCGKVIVDLIPKIYDTERILRIRGETDENEFIEINRLVLDDEGNEHIVNDLSVGKYDVWVDVGAAYSTRRQEAADSMMAFLQYSPQLAMLVGDLIAKNFDWPGADEFAERLKKLLPPQLQEGNRVQEMNAGVQGMNTDLTTAQMGEKSVMPEGVMQ